MTTTADTAPAGGGLRGALRRLVANKDTHEATNLQKEVATAGATPIQECNCGTKTVVIGQVRSITIQPVTSTPALHADLWDGSGSITVIWLGRREIAGIEPDRWLLVEGRPVQESGRVVMYNPRYELRTESSA